jgi:hypothetical protein
LSQTEYRDTSFSLTAYSGNVYIAIETPDYLTVASNLFYVDDIAIENIPQCIEPTVLNAPLVTADTAVLTWTGSGSGKWQVYYGDSATVSQPFGLDSLNGKTVIADSNVYVLRGLEQNKNYKWWVRRVCGVGDTSRWSNSAYFITPPACGKPTNITFATDSTTTRFHWTTNKRPLYWQIYYGIAETTFGPTNYSNLNGITDYSGDTTFTLTNLQYPKLYSVWIQSLCDTLVGNSEWSDTAKLQTYTKNDFCKDAQLVTLDSNETSALTHPIIVSRGAEGLNETYGQIYDSKGHHNDVWYKFVAPSDGKRMTMKTLSTYDNLWGMVLYDSCGGTAITCALGNLLQDQTGIELCPYQYRANATYYLRMYPYLINQQSSTIPLIFYTDSTICPVVPRNDICANAIRFTRTDTIESSTFLATSQKNALPSCEDPNADLYDVWFKFSSGSGANRILNTKVVVENTSRSLLSMTIYKGSCGGLNEVTPFTRCETATNNNAQISIDLMGMEENLDYYVRVWTTIERWAGDFSIHLANTRLRDDAFVYWGTRSRDCDSATTITIDSTNNNRWVPIMRYMDIVAEIKANGQNLGDVKTNFYSNFDTTRTFEGLSYLGRNIRLSASKPPRTPIQMRFYMDDVEWDALIESDSSATDSTFRVVRMVGDTSCKTDVDPTGFALTRMNNAKLSRVGTDYCIEYTTSSLGHFFVTTIPKTTIAYPNARICPSETTQKDSLVGASGGTYTALPAGLTINATTGSVNPTTSAAGLYTVTYAIPDLYGGGVATTTIKIDTATQIIAQPPTRRVLTVGSPITLSVGGVGEGLTYQWRKDSINIPNATRKTLTLPTTSMADTGVYSVVLTGSCGSMTSLNTIVSNDNGIIVNAKVFLQGAFNTAMGLMNDNLRTLNVLPTVEPYSNLSAFMQVKGNKGATATPSVLAASDNTAIVDWVFLELHDATIIISLTSVGQN